MVLGQWFHDGLVVRNNHTVDVLLAGCVLGVPVNATAQWHSHLVGVGVGEGVALDVELRRAWNFERHLELALFVFPPRVRTQTEARFPLPAGTCEYMLMNMSGHSLESGSRRVGQSWEKLSSQKPPHARGSVRIPCSKGRASAYTCDL